MTYRPGGVLYETPITLEDKDANYSRDFWDAGQPKGQDEAMLTNIFKAVETPGTFSYFVSVDKDTGELDEASKRRLSAFRELAFQHGIAMFPFDLNPESGTATARMFRVHETTDRT